MYRIQSCQNGRETTICMKYTSYVPAVYMYVFAHVQTYCVQIGPGMDKNILLEPIKDLFCLNLRETVFGVFLVSDQAIPDHCRIRIATCYHSQLCMQGQGILVRICICTKVVCSSSDRAPKQDARLFPCIKSHAPWPDIRKIHIRGMFIYSVLRTLTTLTYNCLKKQLAGSERGRQRICNVHVYTRNAGEYIYMTYT